MIPKPDNRERLLAETFHGDWSTCPAAAFARNAARSARRRRTVRLALKTSTIAALLIAATFAMTSQREPARIARSASLPAIAATPASASSYEIISDTELLALVSDRPLLVVQSDTSPGTSRQIVTFDD